MQLRLGAGRGIPDDVDVALHELAVATLLRALGAPHRRDLDRAEDGRQLAAVARVEARERHRQVVAQPQIGELGGVVGRGADRVGVESALEDVEGELLVVAADAGVQPVDTPP